VAALMVHVTGWSQTMVAWLRNCRHGHAGKRELMGRVAFNMNISLGNREGT